MSAGLPSNVKEFRKQEPKFKAWLLAHGSEIRGTSNPYEVMRFTTPEGVGVIYCNDRDRISSWMGGSQEAFVAHKKGDDTWRLRPKRDESLVFIRGKNGHQMKAIIERDGDECWYCGGEFVTGNSNPLRCSREHLVAVIHGGPDHLSNLVISHQSCNDVAGNLAVAEKVRLRERMRANKAESA